ncbi:MAG: DUF309 domain-containing protein [Ktedonobacterales bacterium]
MPRHRDQPDSTYHLRQPIPPELYPAERCAGPPPDGLLTGIAQFNQREYFACHETLEQVWNAEPGPIRTLYKGILQVGVGCYHLLRGNYRGATIKLRTGADYLAPFAPGCMGVEVGALIADALRLRAAVVVLGPERIGEVDLALLPRITLAPGTARENDPAR